MTIADKIRTLNDGELMLLFAFGFIPGTQMEVPDEVYDSSSNKEKAESVKEWLKETYEEKE